MSEDRRIHPAVGLVVSVVLGVAMVWLGVRLIETSLWVFESDGPALASVGLGAIGIALVILPVLVVLSQVRAWWSRRPGRSGRSGPSGR